MPPTLPPLEPNDIVEVRFRYKLAGQNVFNILHFRVPVDASGTTVTVENVPDAAEIMYWDRIDNQGIRDASSSQLELLDTTAQVVHPYRGLAFPKTPENPLGEDISDALPPTNCVVIRKKGVNAGKHYQGRMYLPGVPIADVTDGALRGAGVTAYGPIADIMEDVLTVVHDDDTLDLLPVIYNQQSPGDSKEVFVGQLDSIIRQQRRREVGVGI